MKVDAVFVLLALPVKHVKQMWTNVLKVSLFFANLIGSFRGCTEFAAGNAMYKKEVI